MRKQTFTQFRVSLLLSVLLGFFVFTPIPVSAESQMGVHLGLINSSASITLEQTNAGRSGMGFGLFFDFTGGEGFGFQPEFNFVSRGYLLTVSGVELEFSLNYLELPLYLKARFADLGGVQFWALFGPSIGLQLGESCRLSAEATSGSSSDCEGTGVPTHSSFNLAFDLGLNTKIDAFTNAAIHFDVRYSIGASDIFNTQEGGANLDITLTALQFWLGVSWNM